MSFIPRNHRQQVAKRGALDEVDDRTTPDEVFAPLQDRFSFTVDAAAADHNARVERYWTRRDDGLAQDWAGERVWCNPPYSDLSSWLVKARSSARDADLIVLLVPANRTEQAWWQDNVEPYRDGRHPDGPHTEFWRGRTRFIRAGQTETGPNERPPFGCCLLIWTCGNVVQPERQETNRNQSSGPINRAREAENTTMTLGNFQPRARISGDKLDLKQYVGRPLLVRTTEFVPDFTSQTYPNPKPVVFFDAVDLISGQIFINVLTGAGAVVDNLKEYAGTEVVMPLKSGLGSGQSGRTYITLAPLEGNEATAAGQWYSQNWAAVEAERQRRQAMAAPLTNAPAQPVQQPAAQPQQGFGQPVQPAAQPQQGQQFGGPVQGFQGQPNQQGQFPQQAQNALPVQQQGFGQPQAQQAPPMNYGNTVPAQQGMFNDVPPAGQGFAPPQGTDPAAAQAALANLNSQL